jgi:hypothetical protein
VDAWKDELTAMASAVNADMASRIPVGAAGFLRRGTGTAPGPSRYTRLTGRMPATLSSYLGSIEHTLLNGRPGHHERPR